MAHEPLTLKSILRFLRMNHYVEAAAYVAGLTFFFLLLSKPLERLEDDATDLRFAIRGEKAMDSSVVVLYLDNDDIEALGGWPLRRSYYALLLEALHTVGARAVGMDIYFMDRNPEFAEHDRLLTDFTSKCGNAVYACYFRDLKQEPPSVPLQPSPLVQNFLYAAKDPRRFTTGAEINVPFDSLLLTAAGLGQTNLPEERILRHVPVFVNYREALFPSLGFEVLRVYYGARRNGVNISDNAATITDSLRNVRNVPIESDGTVALNYRGSTQSLNYYRFVEFLQSYDSWKSGGTPTMAIDRLRGKIVLVGMIAEGRSPFIATPFDPKYPSIGVHATFLDNALNNRFLTEPSPVVTAVLAFALGYAIFVFAIRRREKSAVSLAVALFAGYTGAGILGFVAFGWVVPFVIPTLSLVGGTVMGTAYKHRVMVERVLTLEEEKRRIQAALAEREESLKLLEQELVAHKETREGEQPPELLDRLKQYHHEIAELSTQATDLEEYRPSDVASDTVQLESEGITYTRSSPMAEVVEFMRKIAPGDSNVLILGDSGTGKEVVARALHHLSPRSGRPFIAVNCGALSETLLESELFGHEKGAFTGAVKEKQGRFELADQSTIFLDEIAETSEAFQVKLLRVLQEGEFERVGGMETKKVNVRVIAATNRDLRAEIAAKQFREDLYYRLNVFTIQLPALRDRRSDIPALVAHFLRDEDASMGISANVMEAFLNYSWRGNIRELESVIKRAVILAKAEKRRLIRLKDLTEEIAEAGRGKLNIEEQILTSLREKEFSRRAISETAAELGGLNRGTVAEYFRGILFKTFAEQAWDIEKAVRVIAGVDEARPNQRVTRKAVEYLSNAVEPVNRDIPFEALRPALKGKYKNLPQRYHVYLDEILKSYYEGVWDVQVDSAEQAAAKHNG